MAEFETEIVVALIAVFASFIGLIISKEQKTSEFRQAWINTLRDDISKFLTEIDRIYKLILVHKFDNNKEESSDKVILESVNLIGLKSKIELLINAKEQKHNQLIQILNKTIQDTKKPKDLNGIEEYKEANKVKDENIKKVTKISQKILKKEWERVKAGELIFRILRWVLGILIILVITFAVFKLLCA